MAAMERGRIVDSFGQFMYVLAAIAGVAGLVALFTLGVRGGAGYLTLVLCICVGSFAFAQWLVRWIFLRDDNSPEMRKVSEAIQIGAEGFLRTQYGAIAWMGAI